MLINLTKRVKLKKFFQVIFDIILLSNTSLLKAKNIFKQSLLKIIQLLAKDIFKQFLKAEIFGNIFSLKNNFNFIAITINNKSKKIYIKIKFEFNDDFIYSLTNNRFDFVFLIHVNKQYLL